MQKNQKRRVLFLSVLTLCILVGYIAFGVGTSPHPHRQLPMAHIFYQRPVRVQLLGQRGGGL